MLLNLRSFSRKVRRRKLVYRRFLSKLKRKPPRNLDGLAVLLEKEVWKEVDCTSCANCCKTMSPTYTGSDIKRIAAYLEMPADALKKKWLKKDRSGDWINKTAPCQFLDLKTNMCSIYDVRPKDCSGFPHLTKRKMTEYMHVHSQNLELCPATFRMVEKMIEKFEV